MNHFAKAVDTLDAEVYSGDALADAANLKLFKQSLERSQRVLKEWEEQSKEVVEDEE